MIAKGIPAKQHDNIPFVICLREDGSSVGKGTKDNTFHPDDVRRAGSTLKIGEPSIHFINRLYTVF